MEKIKANPRTDGTGKDPNARPRASVAIGAPPHDEIARKAFEIYKRNGFNPGQCERNWLEAEKELQQTSQRNALNPASSTGAAAPDEADSVDPHLKCAHFDRSSVGMEHT